MVSTRALLFYSILENSLSLIILIDIILALVSLVEILSVFYSHSSGALGTGPADANDASFGITVL